MNMPTIGDQRAAGGEDVAYGLAGSEDPSIEGGIVGTACEGRIVRIDDHDVGELSGGKAP